MPVTLPPGAAALIARFVRAGGLAMLRMMGRRARWPRPL